MNTFATTLRPLPPPTPELDKEKDARHEAAVIGAFLEWLQLESSIEEVRDINITSTLQLYFDIDGAKCETERRQLLAYQRTLNSIDEHAKELGIDAPR